MPWLTADIEARRVKVAELLLQGCTVRAIARKLSISRSQAHRDTQAVRREWQERRTELMDSVGAEDLARTDAAIAAIWPDVLKGKLTATDRLVSLLNYRAKVLGLGTAQRLELDVGDVLAGILEGLAGDG